MRCFFGRIGLIGILCMTLIWSACSTDWIGQAEQIVAVLIPAASNVVALVAVVAGKDVSAADLQIIQNAGTQAGADLQLIQSLINAYQSADAAAKPGILSQIQTAIGAVQGNLKGLLTAVHIKDAATQAKVTAIVGLVLSEVQSLAAIVPLVSGPAQATALSAADSRGRLSPQSASPSLQISSQTKAPLSANEFVRSYNSTLTARTGNPGLDRVTGGLQIHLHNKVERVASGGVLR